MIETHAKKYGRLHPLIRQVFQRFFEIDLESIKVRIVSYTPKEKIFVIADTIVIEEGALNGELILKEHVVNGKRSYSSNGAVDLSNDTGIQILAHEIKHCEQWRLTPPWKFWLWYIPGVIRGFIEKKRYAHKFIRWEREAIAFQKTVKLSEQEKLSFIELQATK